MKVVSNGSRQALAVIQLKPSTPTTPAALKPSGHTTATAIVYCDGNFAELDGKTANGLVRRSERYQVASVIDRRHAGHDAGTILDGTACGIPIHADLDAALTQLDTVPDVFIYGMAPSSGLLTQHDRDVMLAAMGKGMNVVNGLHEFLNEDPVFQAACLSNKVSILDVRKPKEIGQLRLFSGRIATVSCPVIAVLGTDCAIGKRTTANIITSSLNEVGIKATMVGTGQTGLIQGARYGVALDAIPSQFCAGELEACIVEAFETEHPDVIIVEGQGALSHPAFSTTSFILRGSCPNAVVLQHAPLRRERCDFPGMPMPSPDSEIAMIQAFAKTKVIGLTINHEGMSDVDVSGSMLRYERQLGIPVTDALSRPTQRLVSMVMDAFPQLRARMTTHS
ncbi:MAG: DUF1611 domain-containing protein [Planctomycetota bacterium]|nr:DUF1611 domain-containing protein [Planctomycetota bacterium]